MSLNVLITGASRGIGKAIAARFAKEGANLYLTCLNSYESLCNFSIELSEKYNIVTILKEIYSYLVILVVIRAELSDL